MRLVALIVAGFGGGVLLGLGAYVWTAVQAHRTRPVSRRAVS